MEAVVAAVVTSTLALAGVALTVRQARRESTAQHQALLAELLARADHHDRAMDADAEDHLRIHDRLDRIAESLARTEGWCRAPGRDNG